jgi:hypothetical protein
MSEQRIEKSKAAIEAADHIPAEKKAELLESLAKLKPAIAKVSQEDAQGIPPCSRIWAFDFGSGLLIPCFCSPVSTQLLACRNIRR